MPASYVIWLFKSRIVAAPEKEAHGHDPPPSASLVDLADGGRRHRDDLSDDVAVCGACAAPLVREREARRGGHHRHKTGTLFCQDRSGIPRLPQPDQIGR